MRPAAAPALLLLALSALLAGCAGDEAALPMPEPEEQAPEPTEEGAMTQASDFGWAAATGTPETDMQFLTKNGDLYEVGDGATMLVANVTWTCASPTCGLHAYLCAPGELPTDPVERLLAACAIHAMGGSPLSLAAEAPMAGEWVLHLASDGPTAEVAGSIVFQES